MLGAILLPRLLEAKWIHRRVDSVEFIGVRRTRRSVSIDTEVPKAVTHAHHDDTFDREWSVVPLTFLRKRENASDQQVLRDFHLSDSAGASLSLLDTIDNAHTAWSILIFSAYVAADVDIAAGEDLDEDERDLLWDVVSQPSGAARTAAETIHRMADGHPTVKPYRVLRRAAQQMVFRHLVDRLAEDYLLLAEIDGDPGRRVIRFTYEEPAPRIRPPKGVRARGRTIVRNGAALFGMMAAHYRFRPSSVLPCQSFHLEIELPDHLEASELVVERALRFGASGEGRQEIVPDTRVAEHRSLPHVQVGRLELGEFVVMRLLLRLRREGSTLLTLLLAGSVTVGLLLGRANSEQLLGMAETSRTLLLLVPGLLVTGVLLRREHQLVSQLMTGQRIVGVATVLLAMVAALSLSFVQAEMPATYHELTQQQLTRASVHLQEIWRVLAIIGVMLTLSIVPSLIRVRRRY